MPVSGLSRLLSFEMEDGQQLHLETSARLLQGAAAADSSDAPAPAVEPPLALPPPPPEEAEPPAPLLGSQHQQACRAQQVEQLQEYLKSLGSRGNGSIGGSGGLVQFPAEFPGLVQQLRQARLAECSKQRGGLTRVGLCSGMYPGLDAYRGLL